MEFSTGSCRPVHVMGRPRVTGDAQGPGRGCPGLCVVGPLVRSVAFAYFLVPGQGGQSHRGGLVDTGPWSGFCGGRKHESALALALLCLVTLQ